jgi:hypothetical protein
MFESHAITRRNVLQMAAGLGVSFTLPALDLKAATQRGPEREKSLILLWMAGGPSQLETWDPHPGTKIGGPTRAIDTKLPGVQIADLFPRLAEELDCLNVIRSLVSKEGDHERGTYLVKTGFRPVPKLVHPSVGAMLAHKLPAANIEIPEHISLGGSQWPGRGGYLGDEYDAFRIYDPGRNIQNMRARVGQDRQDQRLKNLEVMSNAFAKQRQFASQKTLHQEMQERALTMMGSEQLKAFELTEESQSTLDAYGDSFFGRGCLVARRLVEQGVRSIEVNLQGFDSHANNYEAHQKNAQVLDPAIAALLKDLKERDLWESTVVLCIGEFGRTPIINPLDGRDHWPKGFSCLVGGGGMKQGLVIGETDPSGQKTDPADPIEVQDLYATLFHLFGVKSSEEMETPIGRPMRISDGKPIKRLLQS